jgi:hypothetical protein
MEEQVQLPHEKLASILLNAYKPCCNFGKCIEAKFDPVSGHVPRGFLGATGKLDQVQAIFVLSEPGHPHKSEKYNAELDGSSLLAQSVKYTYSSIKNGTDLIHRNIRWIISEIWADLNFDQALNHLWITEGRLCSIDNEIGKFKDGICAPLYLREQFKILPNATIIAFGLKANDRVNLALGNEKREVLKVWAVSPPGANNPKAKESWIEAIEYLKRK